MPLHAATQPHPKIDAHFHSYVLNDMCLYCTVDAIRFNIAPISLYEDLAHVHRPYVYDSDTMIQIVADPHAMTQLVGNNATICIDMIDATVRRTFNDRYDALSIAFSAGKRRVQDENEGTADYCHANGGDNHCSCCRWC